MTQAILVKYHGPTNTKGARISATCAGGRVYVPREYDVNINDDYARASGALIAKMGWVVDQGAAYLGRWVGGTLPNGDVAFVFVPSPVSASRIEMGVDVY